MRLQRRGRSSHVAEALSENSGRERTGAFCYAVGWTQHTVGVQYIRAAAIIQLLLGNIGRPGGGIMALRGHASIQGSTDIPTLYNILPGYLPMPHAEYYGDLEEFVERERRADRLVGQLRRVHRQPAEGVLRRRTRPPRTTSASTTCRASTSDHSAYRTTLDMLDGKVKGYFVVGENPAVGKANSKLHRLALAKLDWLVVRDLVEIETAAFWHDSPEIESGELRTEEIGTEIFFLPAAAHTEKDGSFTNTQRLLQWHHKAVEPKGDCRSDLWFYYHLGRLIKERLADSQRAARRPVKALQWDYPTHSQIQEPSADAVLQEINGWDPDSGELLDAYTKLKDDGSTVLRLLDLLRRLRRRRQPGRAQQAALGAELRRARVGLGVAGEPADPLQPRLGRPGRQAVVGAQEVRLVGREAGEVDGPTTCPTSRRTSRPTTCRPTTREAEDAIARRPPVHHAGRRAQLAVRPAGPRGRAAADALRAARVAVRQRALRRSRRTRARQRLDAARQPLQPGRQSERRIPYVLTTYRLTEHHTAGGMSRTLPYLSELQPEMFCEVSPELAARARARARRLGDDLSRARAIEARVLVTDADPADRGAGPDDAPGRRCRTTGARAA